jgi:hypothetical protein
MDLQPLVEKEEFKILPRLTNHHLDCTHNARQRVRLAAQLLSRSTATALKIQFPEKDKAAKFIEVTDSWYETCLNKNCTTHFCKPNPPATCFFTTTYNF